MLTCHREYANEQSNGSSSEHHLLLGIIAFLLLSSGPNANSQNYTVKEHDAHHTSDADHADDDGVVLLSTNFFVRASSISKFYSEKWINRMRDICWASYRSDLGQILSDVDGKWIMNCYVNIMNLQRQFYLTIRDRRWKKATKLNEWIMCLLLLHV